MDNKKADVMSAFLFVVLFKVVEDAHMHLNATVLQNGRLIKTLLSL